MNADGCLVAGPPTSRLLPRPAADQAVVLARWGARPALPSG
jgi:hypothetical protein